MFHNPKSKIQIATIQEAEKATLEAIVARLNVESAAVTTKKKFVIKDCFRP
ncbi:hypothetical protein [Nostoc sp. C052]|uniref:hypothetical protein n=1 Tax=Nostoc sp. C052 TaxID=2576902 RepID=UPI0015C39FC2|nr:hypothetical protein [Nostoc sp. C052]